MKEVLQAGYVQTTPEEGGDGVFKVMVDESGETVIRPVDEAGAELDTFIWFGNDQIEGPGVRTPGFWQSELGQSYWDGDATNDGDPGNKHGFEKQGDGFAENDVLIMAYGEYDTANENLLIGDWNFSGDIDAGEGDRDGHVEEWFADGDAFGDKDHGRGGNGLGISFDAALSALQGDGTDGVRSKGKDWGKFELIERDLVAAWLNYMAGNPVEDGDGDLDQDDAAYWIDQAIAYLNEAPSGKAAREAWNDGIDGVTEVSGSAIHDALDGWNNEGWLNGDYAAFDADSSTSEVSASYYEALDAVA